VVELRCLASHTTTILSIDFSHQEVSGNTDYLLNTFMSVGRYLYSSGDFQIFSNHVPPVVVPLACLRGMEWAMTLPKWTSSFIE
jgi:hypothetical protein